MRTTIEHPDGLKETITLGDDGGVLFVIENDEGTCDGSGTYTTSGGSLFDSGNADAGTEGAADAGDEGDAAGPDAGSEAETDDDAATGGDEPAAVGEGDEDDGGIPWWLVWLGIPGLFLLTIWLMIWLMFSGRPPARAGRTEPTPLPSARPGQG